MELMDPACSDVVGIQPSRTNAGCQATTAGTGRLAPVLTQSVEWPRHFIAAMPTRTVTLPLASSSSFAGGWGSVGLTGGLGGSAGGLCWQHGIMHPGLCSQQVPVGFGGAGFGAQQHWPSWHSSVEQPHALTPLPDRDSAGTGTPRAAIK